MMQADALLDEIFALSPAIRYAGRWCKKGRAGGGWEGERV